MTHWKKLFNPNYLGSYAFEPGEEKPVTIKSINQEEVTNPADPEKGKEVCTVAHFVQPVKPLILNKTNSKVIAKLAKTPNIEQWPGVSLILCVQKVKAFGELTDAVRIRPVPPFFCADCGGVITGYGGKSHAEIRDHTKKTYKRQLCPECALKAAALAPVPDPVPAAEPEPVPAAVTVQEPETAAPVPTPDQQPHRRRRATA